MVGVSFVGCSIWNYERYRTRINQVLNPKNWRFVERNAEKYGEIRSKVSYLFEFEKKFDLFLQVNQWWNQLTTGKKTVFAIAGLNSLI